MRVRMFLPTAIAAMGLIRVPAVLGQTESDTSRAFRLGTVEVKAPSTAAGSPFAERISGELVTRLNRVDLASALGLAAGLAVTNGGPRNESNAYLRGFDLRQVPLFIDGIPVYVPYDGYVDLRRFTTFDLAEISVAKGMSSVLGGPNAMGGSINLVTRRPVDRLELAGSAGAFSANGFQGDLSLGVRRDRWYVQGAGSWLTADAFPLSKGFQAGPNQPAGRRANSARDDWRASLKLGYLPRPGDEYALVVASQQGTKGNPPYAGTDPTQAVRFWRWPQWDKHSAYLLTQTRIGSAAVVRGRWYYDHFENQLFAYDDATYTTQSRRSSFRSFYSDPTVGGSVALDVPTGPRNVLRWAIHAKWDLHREHNANEPIRHFNDRTASIALEDTWAMGSRMTLVAGLSYERRSTSRAEDFQNNTVASFPLGANDAWNPQLALVREVGAGALRASVSSRTRFPTIKDRYSYRLGTAIPNPDLASEAATHVELSYAGPLGRHVQWRAAAFVSSIDDAIQRVDDVARSAQNTALFQLQNVGEARHAGFELGADLTVARVLTAGGSYTFLDRRNLTQPAIKPVDTPRHRAVLWAEWRPLTALSLGADGNFDGRRVATSAGAVVDGFAVINARAGVRLRPDIAIEIGVANLFDQNYQLAEGYPEPGRVVFTRIRFAAGSGSGRH